MKKLILAASCALVSTVVFANTYQCPDASQVKYSTTTQQWTLPTDWQEYMTTQNDPGNGASAAFQEADIEIKGPSPLYFLGYCQYELPGSSSASEWVRLAYMGLDYTAVAPDDMANWKQTATDFICDSSDPSACKYKKLM